MCSFQLESSYSADYKSLSMYDQSKNRKRKISVLGIAYVECEVHFAPNSHSHKRAQLFPVVPTLLDVSREVRL